MTPQDIKSALALWGLENCPFELIAQRENKVYRVTNLVGAPLALRVHRPKLRSDAQIISELQIMQALDERGLRVPAPLKTLDGEHLVKIGDNQVDLLSWVDGYSMVDIPPSSRSDVFRRLGEVTANLHNNIDAWRPSSDFDRASWDRTGLIGAAPLWGAFWGNPSLNEDQRKIILAAKADIDSRLAEIESGLDYGLIHADMVRENVLIDNNNQIGLIDFDDCGFGFRAFELATILQAQMETPEYQKVKAALLKGYVSKRAINLEVIDMFIVLRSWTYLGWIIPKMNEPGSVDRNARYVARCVRRAQQWLEGQPIC